MTKFNVGDKVRVLNKREILGGGHLVDGNTYRVDTLFHGHPVIRGRVIVSSEYHAIELVTDDTNRRLTEAEAKIATLEAEVKALKVAGVTTNITVNANSQTFDSHLFARKLADALGVTREPSLTPNQRRSDVIKRAQAFVADLEKECGRSLAFRDSYSPTIRIYGGLLPDYVINADKRTVVVLLRYKHVSPSVAKKAVAKCAPDDVFNADIGKAIAIGRALGVKVPKEFTDAVKPTEVVVGMVVESSYEFARINGWGTGTVRSFRNDGYVVDDESWAHVRYAVIIDDSDAVYI